MPLDDPRSPAPLPIDDSPLLDAYSRAVVSTVDRVGPAVVRVERLADGKNPGGGVGSGVVIAGDGLVLTNSHVVGGALRMRLSFADGSHREAAVLGDDPDTDLALLRTDLPAGTQAAALGDSKALRRGQLVVAIGNRWASSPRLPRRRVGARPVAARHLGPADRRRDPDRRVAQSRQLGRAACFKRGRGRGHQHRHDQRAQGICFAVASNTAVFVVSEFIAHGRVRRAHIGIAAETVPLPRRIVLATGAGTRAIRISEVMPGGPAAAAGLLRAISCCRSTALPSRARTT